MDCLPFLNWRENRRESDQEQAAVFRSLVTTVKFQPALDASLEAKAVKFLESIVPQFPFSPDAFLISIGQTTDESLKNFVQYIGVLLSSPNQALTTSAMKTLRTLIRRLSDPVSFALVKADLIPQLINTLNPQSLSFAEGVDIHIHLLAILTHPFWLSTPYYLRQLGFEDRNEQESVHEIILKQVVVPSEKYVCHLSVNRYSIVDGEQSKLFMEILAQLLRVCPYYQQTMDFVFNMQVIVTIPSCLTFFENDRSLWNFYHLMNTAQQELNAKDRELRLNWQTVHRMLRMEGIEDVSEEKLQNDQNILSGRWIVTKSIGWNNVQGMNVPKQE
ncbi:hypothetical protein BLNAU_8447 [Blattamonas nauphoetae]|uniref:Uncharacterized protein n=1 Tax=Blattamonas nauphoetae TaxID=2049346 RepID=A0ABQ9XYP2_9EUKA|nr:hypothetical protein BLNAU_8447 [Blattamonas nauphoetae]